MLLRSSTRLRATAIAALAVAAASLGCSSRTVDAVIDCVASSCASAGTSTGGRPQVNGGAMGVGGSGNEAGSVGMGGGTAVRPILRYSFDDTGSDEVTDSIGNRGATLVGARYGTDDAAGTVVFAGKTSEQYVTMPNRLLAGLRDATFESWVSWRGGEAWQRVFDFGEDTSGAPDSREEQPRSYLFLAFKPEPRAVFKKPPVFASELVIEASFEMPTDILTHVAVVVDDSNDRFSLYVEGREEASREFTDHLSDIYDAHDWLGRSLFRADANLTGSMSEFRVYDRALTAEQLQQSYLAGADVLP